MDVEVVDCAQRSDEWYAARLGWLTSSRAAAVLARRKDNDEAAGRRNLRVELVLERLMGRRVGRDFRSWEMQQGAEREPDARTLYEALTGRIVVQTGFVRSTVHAWVGCSLDGHVGDFEGVVEAKCPIPATHFDFLRTGKVPAEYVPQILHQLWVTGARWADFVSYNPDFPDRLQAKVARVARDDRAVAAYALEALQLLREVDAEALAVRRLEADAGAPVF